MLFTNIEQFVGQFDNWSIGHSVLIDPDTLSDVIHIPYTMVAFTLRSHSHDSAGLLIRWWLQSPVGDRTGSLGRLVPRTTGDVKKDSYSQPEEMTLEMS